MSKFEKYPSIDQYRNVIKRVRDVCRYDGIALPILTFVGTTKLHGTNAGVGYNPSTGELWAMSRKNVITPENDNYGFARFVEDNKEDFLQVISKFDVDGVDELYLYGEWCGPGVQKGVGISNIPEKIFVMFESVRVVGEDKQYSGISYDTQGVNFPRIKSIDDFGCWGIDIDFSNPEEAQNKLVAMTDAVEKQCPVAQALGAVGIGEGIVWSSQFKGENLRFKVKGEKHSVSKVKKLAEVDPEKVASVKAFIDKTVTENRLTQGLTEVFGEGEPDIKQMGSFIKWVVGDIMKEETDVIEVSGLTNKELGSPIATAARQWLMKRV